MSRNTNTWFRNVSRMLEEKVKARGYGKQTLEELKRRLVNVDTLETLVVKEQGEYLNLNGLIDLSAFKVENKLDNLFKELNLDYNKRECLDGNEFVLKIGSESIAITESKDIENKYITYVNEDRYIQDFSELRNLLKYKLDKAKNYYDNLSKDLFRIFINDTFKHSRDFEIMEYSFKIHGVQSITLYSGEHSVFPEIVMAENWITLDLDNIEEGFIYTINKDLTLKELIIDFYDWLVEVVEENV